MRIFGFNITREKAAKPVTDWRRGWRVIHEPYTGAWQKNDELKRGDLTCYPALYACLNRITQDIGKLPFLLKRKGANGIWEVAENPAWSPVLRKPNGYQTAQQFREAWILSKLLDGNTFVLKQRDNRGVVTSLYVLDPSRVDPLVSEAGRVFYRLNYGTANNLLPESYGGEQITVPASEIIHDRINPFHHQLLGVPPLCAAALAAGKNFKILRNSSAFFGNNASPGGLITAPAGLTEEEADAIQAAFNERYSGENSGKIAVIGADLKFTPFAFKAADSQLVEQLRYSDEQICQPFGIPPFKIGIGSIPAGMTVDQINLLYHEDALSGHIEAMENLLDEALSLPQDWGIWLDTDPLFRMDVGKQAEVETKLVEGMIKTPNEARFRFGLEPTGGGDTLWGQKQDFPLQVLADNHPDMQTAAQHAVQAAPPSGRDDDSDNQEQIERGIRAITALNTIKALDAARSEAFR
jgi:HK97 family phage portal protein